MSDDKKSTDWHRKADLEAARRLVTDPIDAFVLHLSLTVGMHTTALSHQNIIGVLTDYLSQYISRVTASPEKAEEVVDRLSGYMKDRVGGKAGSEADRPDLQIIN